MFGQSQRYEVPLKGNAHVIGDLAGAAITPHGLQKWSSKESQIVIPVYFNKPQTVRLRLKGEASAKAKIAVTIGEKKRYVKLKASSYNKRVGKFKIKEAGRHSIILQGVRKEHPEFAFVKSIIIESDDSLVFVNDF